MIPTRFWDSNARTEDDGRRLLTKATRLLEIHGKNSSRRFVDTCVQSADVIVSLFKNELRVYTGSSGRVLTYNQADKTIIFDRPHLWGQVEDAIDRLLVLDDLASV